MDGIAPALTGGDLLHLDGQCFVGDFGVLGVALKPASLARLKRVASPTHWLVPINDPHLVQTAATLPGQVLWLMSNSPAHVLGLLAEDVRGAWFEGASVVVNVDGKSIRLLMTKAPHPAFAMSYLARIVSDMWINDDDSRPLIPHLNLNRKNELISK